MSTVTLYTFENDNGSEDTYTTFNPRDAEDRGRRCSMRVIANEYEYSDHEIAWDFTATDE